MKIQIVYLSPEDDVHSTREMLSWVKAPRALLVWPDRGRVLQHQLDLVLIKRFSQQRKIKIGLLTFDAEIRERSAELGIPVFDSIDELPEVNWGSDIQIEMNPLQKKDFTKVEFGDHVAKESSTAWFEKLNRTRKAVIIGTMTILSLLFVFLLLPSTTIYVSPIRIAEMMEFEVIPITDEFSRTEIGHLPLESVILKISGIRKEETSGISRVPRSRAEGSVTFTNLSSQPITIPFDTIVRTSAEGGTRYRTTKPVLLPGWVGEQVLVPIESLILGESGNVTANAISYIEGSLGLVLKVTNPIPVKGGSDEVRRMVSGEDLQRIEQKLMAELMLQAESEMKHTISPDRILVEGRIDLANTVASHFNYLENELSDTVTLDMTLEFVAESLSASDLQIAALQSLSDDLSHGFQIVQDSMEFQSAGYISGSETGDEGILITVRIDTYQSIDIENIKVIVRGKRPSEAIRLLLEHIDLAFAPDIKMKPDWFPILPLLNERIELRQNGEKPG